MSMGMVEAIRVSDQHLDPQEVAGYIDRAVPDTERARIEAHLATCAECRGEIADAGRIMPQRIGFGGDPDIGEYLRCKANGGGELVCRFFAGLPPWTIGRVQL